MTMTRSAPGAGVARSVLLVSATCFVALALAALLLGTFSLDVAVRDAILALATPAFLQVMRVVNVAGDWKFLVPGTLLLYVVFPRARARWWVWVALMLVATAAPDVLKDVVGRPRPERDVLKVAMGFPSGHASAAAAYFGAVMYLAGSLRPAMCRALRIAAPICIALVAVARVGLRAHWQSDTLGGIALGLALASAAALVAALPPAAVASARAAPAPSVSRAPRP